MKKPELLSPAGNMSSLKAAIQAGCDAVYLGGKQFGARAFASNFSNEELIEAIKYAHLYGVRVYVTVNTLIYENEVETFMEYIDFLYRHDVDAVIMQDIGILDLVRKTYPDLEIHASTQIHIHNEEGVKLVSKLGVKRYVIARETDFETIKELKKKSDLEIEVFVHGALCISYSGQCLMSSLIGGRSGNRGSCAGSCRLKYDFINEGRKLNHDDYILSTKDLNSLENIGLLIEAGVDSLKLEGRMKSPYYVYMVTSLYRKAIDSYLKCGKVSIDKLELEKLKRIFNRLFTKGFLFNAGNNDIINSFRPNHLGSEIGTVLDCNDKVKVKLSSDLAINDGIRFIGKKDSGLIVTSIIKDNKKVLSASKGDIVLLKVKEHVQKGSKVVKTTDYKLTKELDAILKKENRKVNIKGKLVLKVNEPINLTISDNKNSVNVTGAVVLKAQTSPLTHEQVYKQITKLGSTIYNFSEIAIDMDENVFVPIKDLNEIRRKATQLLDAKRMYKRVYNKQNYNQTVPNFERANNYSILINNVEEYNMIKDKKLDTIYINSLTEFQKINDSRAVLKLERVMNNFLPFDSKVLVGELGSVNFYKNKITDFSLNVVNSYSVAILHALGVERVTLSYELNDYQIESLIKAYHERYHAHPNLELIVYAKEEVMISKFNLNDYFNVKGKSYLKDRFGNMYPIIIENNLMHIYNYQTRHLKNDDAYFKMGINHLRFNVFSTQDIKNIFL